ncbi:MAG: aminotransferase class I/II-fold pyridoxal phosphate-dependent enzyme, partial [Nostocaceae cyanobacterium]|nr:aminotransferase class I/II-fold pyridoxal phosphate-dependent enzyme [Nostocaceae cyanobacterium]
DVEKTKATMYLWVPTPVDMTSSDFAMSLLQQTGVVVTPGTAFGSGGEGYVRISLIADCDRLGEVLRRFKQAGIRHNTEALASRTEYNAVG